MYYDLDVRIGANNRSDALEELHRLGYDVVAFTTTIKGTSQLLPENCPQNPQESKTWYPRQTISSAPSPEKRKKQITVLERVTLVIEEPSQLVLLTSPLLSNFDIVAIQPSTEKLLQQSLQFDFDVISVCLSKKQQFHIKKPHANVAAEKGIMFEICFADALRDRVTRRFVVSNACALSRATSKRHIILSSGARRIMELRGPHDTINLGMIFDLPYESGRSSVTSLPQQVVSHGDIRANTYKGIVRVVGQVQSMGQDKLELSRNNAGVDDTMIDI